MIGATCLARWMTIGTLGSILLLSPTLPRARGQDDVADVPSTKLAVGDDEKKSYFLIGAKDGAVAKARDAAPPAGYGLIIIMPGGDGSADFHPFVRRIYKNGLPEGYLAVQPIAVKWTADQQIVWPTEKSGDGSQKFSTEQFVKDIIAAVKAKHRLNPARIFTLSWSSSGPGAYAISLSKDVGVTGSFVAMSVFKPDQLPPLESAAGHAYFIYHSPDDKVCPMRMAEEARDKLSAAKAKVEFATYAGGHGWKGNVYGDIRRGIEWLEKNAAGPGNEASKEDKK